MNIYVSESPWEKLNIFKRIFNSLETLWIFQKFHEMSYKNKITQSSLQISKTNNMYGSNGSLKTNKFLYIFEHFLKNLGFWKKKIN